MNLNSADLKDLYGTEDAESIIKQKLNESSKRDRALVTTKGRRVKLTAEECKDLCAKAKVDYLDGYESRVVERVFTDETVDRYGDIVKYDGADLKNYIKNPVALTFHNGQSFPIGVTIKIWKDDTKKAIVGWIMFLDDRVDPTGVSETAFRYATSGVLKTVSIGFLPKQGGIQHPSEEERKTLGMGPYGVILTNWELIEISLTPVPANPNARELAFVKERSMYDNASLEDAREENLFSDELIDELENILLSCQDTSNDFYEDVGIVLRPYPNEHACRLKDPGNFEKFRRGTRKSGGKTYSVIFGKSKGSDSWQEQAYRYAKDTWTAEEARKHCKDHDGSFEAAQSGKGVSLNVSGCTVNDSGSLNTVPYYYVTNDTKFNDATMEILNVLINKLTLTVEKLSSIADSVERLCNNVYIRNAVPQCGGEPAADSADLLYSELAAIGDNVVSAIQKLNKGDS